MEGSATRWGARDAVVVGTRLLAVLYALQVPAGLVLYDGGARVVTTALSALAAVVFAVAARYAFVVSDRVVDLLLLVVCLLPLVHSLVHLAAAGTLVHTVGVLLITVVIGAVARSRRSAWTLVAVSCASWLAVVTLARPRPLDEVPFFAAQLALAALLSLAIFEIRLSAYRRLSNAVRRSDLGLRRFRSVFDASPVGIGLADGDGRLLEANTALCRLVGRPERDVLGHTLDEFTHPADLRGDDLVAGIPLRAASSELRVERRFLRPDGEHRWAWMTLAHVAGPAGESWMLAHLQDVTSRRQAEDDLRLSRESLAAAMEIARSTQRGDDPRPVVLRHLKRLADASFVSLIEPLGDDRLVVTAVDGEVDLVGLSMDRTEDSVTTHVWRTGESVFASQVSPNPLVGPRLLAESGAASLMWQPVGVPGDVQAVLSIAWDDPLPHVHTAGRAAVEAVAVEAGAALTNERMRLDLELSTVTDTLTGLLNRRGWDAAVDRLRQHSARTGDRFTLALVDLDHFKRYNDTFGHLAGDEALKGFAVQAQQALRAVDVLARWGGEEFTVALHATSGQDALEVLERLRGCAPSGLTCSVGYVEVGPGDDLERGLSAADAALYQAKGSGRDRVVSGAVDATGG
ncbi:MAG: diguanylate cyclase [Nocardioidaceae bacterium]